LRFDSILSLVRQKSEIVEISIDFHRSFLYNYCIVDFAELNNHLLYDPILMNLIIFLSGFEQYAFENLKFMKLFVEAYLFSINLYL
jgi:hypothetical protein